jgi:hypothetical protein
MVGHSKVVDPDPTTASDDDRLEKIGSRICN